MPLAACVPHETPGGAQLEAVRRKYMLPGRFILMLGTVEPRHNHEVLFEAVGSLGERERAIRAEGLCAAQRAAPAAGPELPGWLPIGIRGGVPPQRQGGAASPRACAGEAPADTAVRPAASSAERVGIVVCGRRTAYSDSLLEFARGRHMASRVDFIYELSPDDLPALFRLAHAFVYLPRCRDRGVDRARGGGDACRGAHGAERHALNREAAGRRRGLCPP